MSLTIEMIAAIEAEVIKDNILAKDFKDMTRADCRFLREHVGGLWVILLSVVVAMDIWMRQR